MSSSARSWAAYSAYKEQQAGQSDSTRAEVAGRQAAPATQAQKPSVPAKPIITDPLIADLKLYSSEFDRATRAYKQCKFGDASSILKQLDIKTLPAEWKDKMTDLVARATVFAGFIAGIPSTELVGHSDMVVLDLTTGGKVEGRLLEETPTSVKIRRIGGIVADIPRSQIRLLQKLDPVLAKGRLEQEYLDKVKRLGSSPSPLRYVELGIVCYKQQLLPQALDAFDKAYVADNAIGERYAEEQARLLYQMYLWYLGTKGDTLCNLLWVIT